MKKSKSLIINKLNLTILWYGLLMAVLVFVLKLIEYRYIIRDFSLEVYIGLVATLFTTLGVWIGLKIIDKKKSKEATTEPGACTINEEALQELGISNREYEVLQLMAKGLSNQEIADQLFISLPTVKTHSSNLFNKLNVKRRTQAIHKAKELNIIP